MNRWARLSGSEGHPNNLRDLRSSDASHASRWSTPLRQCLVGSVAAAIAVAVRYFLPFPPDLLPTFTLVIAISLVTMTEGLWAGATAMILGGVLASRFILAPHSWKMVAGGYIVLGGYFAVSCVILATAELYRRSEERRNAAQLAHAVQEAETHELFASEMSHRLKNSLAIVQSMAVQSFGDETPEFVKFAGRLHALAAANNLLNEHVKQPSADVRDVVETAVGPFRADGDVFSLSGPPLALASQDVVSLTIALHELATNAVKYGALSDPNGRIAVTWTSNEGKLFLEWKEHDGPPVNRPLTSGFGSRLLRRAAMGSDLQFEEDGIRCTIRAR